MKLSIKKRLQSLEVTLNVNQRPKCALIVCDPDILQSFDFSIIEADYKLILPDNGHRMLGDLSAPKGSYIVTYH